jgi:hypothetical protein
VGVTQGHLAGDLTPESVQEHLAQALDRQDSAVPVNALDEAAMAAAFHSL